MQHHRRHHHVEAAVVEGQRLSRGGLEIDLKACLRRLADGARDHFRRGVDPMHRAVPDLELGLEREASRAAPDVEH
jgi:hypothetical protein